MYNAPVRWSKILLGAGGIAGVLSLLLVAFAGARTAGRMTHCRNNLKYLGERAVEVIREAHLNEGSEEADQVASARGKEFWRLLLTMTLPWRQLIKGSIVI